MNVPPHFYTLTGNLLAERTLDFAAWSPGKTQRATSASFQVGGKGINASKMLNRLGVANTALCFTGGASGAECTDWLRTNAFDFRAFPTTSPTRSGFVVRAPAQSETTFLGPDAPPDASALRACAPFIDALPSGVAFALCGSFPGWNSADAEPLRAALDRLIVRATVCIDTYGPPLAWFAARPVALVKINRDEFDSLSSPLESSEPVLARLAKARDGWPVQRWIVTDGPRDVCFVGPETPPTAQRPPHVQEISATGSGDVLFACVLASWLVRGFSLAAAVSFALPFASANAKSTGIADFSMNQLPELRSLPA
jgi:1-phosphofructokinase